MAMTTGLRPETFRHLQLNAGACLTDFDYSSLADYAALKAALPTVLKDETKTLGATRGGGTFDCTPEVREIEADGKRYGFIGSTVFDSWTVRLTGTLMEIRASNFKRVIAAADVSGTNAKKIITVRTDILPDDYIPSLVWIGDMSDGGYILIALKNALNTTGATLTFTDKGEGTLPFEFHAHQGSVDDYDVAPVEIVIYPKDGAAQKINPLKETAA